MGKWFVDYPTTNLALSSELTQMDESNGVRVIALFALIITGKACGEGLCWHHIDHHCACLRHLILEPPSASVMRVLILKAFKSNVAF